MKEDKYAVLSRTAQAVMKNNNEYLQFNTNRDNVEADDIGVRYLLTAALEERIKEYRRSLLKGQHKMSLRDVINDLKDLMSHFSELDKETGLRTSVAQIIEHSTGNRKVVGSIPSGVEALLFSQNKLFKYVLKIPSGLK